MTRFPGDNEAYSQGQAASFGALGAARRATFGRRLQPPMSQLSFRRERLQVVGAELEMLFGWRIAGTAAFAELEDEGEPKLIVGRAMGLALTVEIDATSGHFILFEERGRSGCAIVTASEERLVDHVFSVAATASEESDRRTPDVIVDLLVGRSLRDIERRLIVRTLLHFRGDRQEAARALQIDEAVLRSRLRRYFMDARRALLSGEGDP